MTKYFWLLIPLFIFFALLPNFCFSSTNSNPVVINEVFYNPIGTDTGKEWIELYNPSDQAIDLTNYQLNATSGDYYTFPSGFILNSGNFVIIHWRTDGINTSRDLYTGLSGYLVNMGDSYGWVALFKNSSHIASSIIDYVEYGKAGRTWEPISVTAGIWTVGDFVPNVVEGHSIARDPIGYDSDSPADFIDQAIPSPGISPVILDPATAITKNSVQLSWSEYNLDGFVKYEIHSIDETGTENVTEILDKSQVTYTINNLEVSSSYQFFIRVFNNSGFSADSNIIIAQTDFDRSGSIIILEILPKPNNGSSNEFIELYNEGAESADLAGWYLDDIDGGSSPYQIPKGTKILPNQYLAFYNSETGIGLNDSGGDMARLLWPDKTTVVSETPNYGDAKSGMAFINENSNWQWSRTATPYKLNISTPQYLPQKINVIQNKVEQVQVSGQIIMAPGDFAQSYFYVSDGSFALKIETSDKLKFSYNQCLNLFGTISTGKEKYLSLDDYTNLTDCSLISPTIFVDSNNQLLKSLIGRLVNFNGEVYTENSSYFINYQGQKIKIRSLSKLHKGIGDVQGILGFGTSYYQLFIVDASWFQVAPIINSPPAKSLVGVDENDTSKVVFASFGTVKAAAYTPPVDYRNQSSTKNNSNIFLIFYYFSLIIFSALAKILLFS